MLEQNRGEGTYGEAKSMNNRTSCGRLSSRCRWAERTAVVLYYRENMPVKEVARAWAFHPARSKRTCSAPEPKSRSTCEQKDSTKATYHELR